MVISFDVTRKLKEYTWFVQKENWEYCKKECCSARWSRTYKSMPIL